MHLTRREILALGAAVTAAGAVAGCSSEPTATPSAPQPEPRTVPDLELIALYAAVRRTYPDLGTALAEIEEQHRAHVAALGEPDTSTELAVTVAATKRAALEQCMVAERRAADLHEAACLNSDDPTLARLLAVIAASEASHVPALERLL